MTEEIEEKTTKKQKISASEMFGCVLAVLSIYFLVCFFLAKPIAIIKSFDSDNILEGCLYYKGIGNKNSKIFSINGSRNELYSMYVKSFPYAKKNTSFRQRNHCYKVQYIVVDFSPFMDIPYFNRYFIYDYIGE
ncbi:hypothetical protein [Moraxella bovis]|uniref:hypothetical protein n=1 Tax=Moraxella bovis TaxID=476 RepID=UPI00099292D6|nr:hypothetical protein [Moraxella bovis]OOR88934.1 hypothetical protein B0182_08515 [Moraxella bovis]